MHRPPGARPDQAAQVRGDDEREQQVERDRAKTEPDRPVRREERDDPVRRPIGANPSATVVTTCTATKTTESKREVAVQPSRSRSAASVAVRARSEAAMPSETEAVSSTSATDAGAAGQVPELASSRQRPRCSAGQAPTRETPPASIDEPGRQPARGEPGDGAVACDDRRRRGHVCVHARGGCDRHRPPQRSGRERGARVDDVVSGAAVGRPAANGDARGGETAGERC